LEDLAMKPGDEQALRELFAGWGFKSLLFELDQSRSKSLDFFEQEGAAAASGKRQ